MRPEIQETIERLQRELTDSEHRHSRAIEQAFAFESRLAKALSELAAEREKGRILEDSEQHEAQRADRLQLQVDALRKALNRFLYRSGSGLWFVATNEDAIDYAVAALAQTAPEAPSRVSVAGSWLPVSIANFIRRCEVSIETEQTKALPDNALVALLCDSVRLAREYALECYFQTAPEGEKDA